VLDNDRKQELLVKICSTSLEPILRKVESTQLMDMTNLPLRVGRRLLYLTLHVLLVWSNHAWVPPSLCCCTKSHIATNTSLTCINPLHMHTIILFLISCCTHHIETLFRNRMFCSFLLNS